MAARYARAAGGSWNTDATWSTTTGGAADTVAPTAADDVFLDGNSGNVTFGTGTSVCRSINCTNYAGTLLLDGSSPVSIGDGTAGASNIALKFVSGMTFTCNSQITSVISFISTSATVQTIDFAGKTTGGVTFNATSGGSWQYTGAHNTGATGTVTLTKGTLDINGQTCSWGLFSSTNSNTRSLTLGAAAITLTGTGTPWAMNDCSNMTLSAGSSTITLSGGSAGFSSGATGGTTKTFGTVIFSGSAIAILSGANTFGAITRTGTAAKTDSFQINGDNTVTGTLTLTGNSSINRILIFSNTVGTARTITAATWSVTNTDFQDITGAGAGSRDFSAQTDIGDCGGNTSITFPASVAQTWSGTSSGNWSTNAWTTRVPLPQDDVSLGVAFSASQTVTADMPRLGRSIDWTGATGSPTWANGTTSNAIYGSITLISGMTISGTGRISLSGRGNYTLTSAGKTYTMPFTLSCPSGTYTLQDAFSYNCALQQLIFTRGTLTTNGFSMSFEALLTSGSSQASTFNGGTSIITLLLTNTGNAWATFSGYTQDMDEATIVIANASANTRTFAGGGSTYGTLTYTVAGSTGELDITGANSFAAINFSDVTNARTLKFTAATTTTIRDASGWQVNGTSGKLMTVTSITGATHTISCASGNISSNYIDLSYSIGTGGALFFAGSDSTNSGNNTGWLFVTSPSPFTASGGTITTDGAYTVHSFTSSGTFTPNGSGNVDALVVAGGGGGGDSSGGIAGGGGGAGGLIYDTNHAVTAQAYSVTVGAGGANETNGSDSIFDTYTAKGGGRGGAYNGEEAGDQGSGGGAVGFPNGTYVGGTATASQGNDGGLGATDSATWTNSGGGGGAGAVGGNADATAGGLGGNGTSNSITGSAVTYAGGGGGGGAGGGKLGSNGGTGGGGKGGDQTGTTVGANGTDNLGGGGGGGGGSASAGGTGGSGVVIIRYLTADSSIATGSGIQSLVNLLNLQRF